MLRLFKISTSFVLLMCLYVLHVQSISEEMLELAMMIHDTCLEETGVDDDLVDEAREGNFADDAKLKCYMKCIMDQMATMDENGNIDTDMVLSVLPDELKSDNMVNALKSCGTKVGADHCDNAFLTNKCWYEMAPKEYFLV